MCTIYIHLIIIFLLEIKLKKNHQENSWRKKTNQGKCPENINYILKSQLSKQRTAQNVKEQKGHSKNIKSLETQIHAAIHIHLRARENRSFNKWGLLGFCFCFWSFFGCFFSQTQ